jgi:TonB family protein
MTSSPPPLDEVFSVAEVARAARVERRAVRQLVDSGVVDTVNGVYLPPVEALRVAVALRHRVPLAALAGPLGQSADGTMPIFGRHRGVERTAGLPAAVSTAVHLFVVAAVAWITSLGLGPSTVQAVDAPLQTSRLVFLDLPGPGGGGGGGGTLTPAPPPPARREGRDRLDSPLPRREPPPPVEPPPPAPPPELEVEPLPPIIAPVAAKAADPVDQAGVLDDELPPPSDSRGPGEAGGVGSGAGTGIGAGQGSGIGDGSDGGTGGGPYRPGAGITPPSLLREVKPDYSEEARRRGIRGDVVLEIVVLADGRVGDIRVIEGLGFGLDQRAVDAVRQWRFSPAHRFGTPVDVVVEVAVEFKLR